MDMASEKLCLQKIGVIVPGAFIPPTEGGQRVCFDLCLALAKRLRVICFSVHPQESLPELDLVPLFYRSRLKYIDISLIWPLVSQIRKHKLRFCIVNQPFFFFIAFLASKICGCKLITYAHNLEFRRTDGARLYFRPLIFLLELTAFHFSHKAFFISRQELNEARRIFRLSDSKCILVPHIAHKTHGVIKNEGRVGQPFTIIFFGNFSYPPNLNALNNLLERFVPAFTRLLTFDCRILIFGKSIPETFKNGAVGKNLSIEFLGYVENPLDQLRYADVMINPVDEGGGVQTKIIETLAAGTTVVSARSGARGIDQELAPEKLLLVEDGDWAGFAEKICGLHASGKTKLPTPAAFFSEYAERAITDRIVLSLTSDGR
jgi:polysaccharide biosynthesis protein PslH